MSTLTPVPVPWPARLAGRLRHRSAVDGWDVAVAAGCWLAGTLPVLLGAGPRPGSLPLAMALSVLANAPLVLRRRRPVAVLSAVTAAVVASMLLDARFTPFVSSSGPSMAVAVFTAAAQCSRRRSLPAAVGCVLATWAAAPAAIALHPGVDQDAFHAMLAIPAWLLGDLVRSQRQFRQDLAAGRQRAEEDRELRARAEERLRVSREVHDIVSHSLAVIAVRAGVARLLIEERPAEARAALDAVETTSRSALDELRSVLRRTRRSPGEDDAARTLDDLAGLVAGAEGLEVALDDRAGRGHPAALQASVFRLVQEALTNAVKHAGPARVRVALDERPDRLLVTVTDDGSGPASGAAAGGFGLIGMRERVESHGGVFAAGRGPGGRGFAVTAEFPTGAEAAR